MKEKIQEAKGGVFGAGLWASMSAATAGASWETGVFFLFALIVLVMTLRKAGQVTSRYLADRAKADPNESGYEDLPGSNPPPKTEVKKP